jgi:hypothetical protein
MAEPAFLMLMHNRGRLHACRGFLYHGVELGIIHAAIFMRFFSKEFYVISKKELAERTTLQ